MILIAHRGNIEGPNPQLENDPNYIINALERGFDVEIDLWWTETDEWCLGHDKPQHKVFEQFIHKDGLWIHCKNYAAFQKLIPTDLNFFYHTDEDYVLTSHKYIWAYPGNVGNKYTICVMPEWNDTPVKGFAGVCSDHVRKYLFSGHYD